jgi:hypothetical protein
MASGRLSLEIGAETPQRRLAQVPGRTLERVCLSLRHDPVRRPHGAGQGLESGQGLIEEQLEQLACVVVTQVEGELRQVRLDLCDRL